MFPNVLFIFNKCFVSFRKTYYIVNAVNKSNFTWNLIICSLVIISEHTYVEHSY